VPAFNRQKELYFLLLWFAQSPGRQSSQAPLNICTQFTSLKTKKIKAGQQQSTLELQLKSPIFSLMASRASLTIFFPPFFKY
jgi:hypothetical protein